MPSRSRCRSSSAFTRPIARASEPSDRPWSDSSCRRAVLREVGSLFCTTAETMGGGAKQGGSSGTACAAYIQPVARASELSDRPWSDSSCRKAVLREVGPCSAQRQEHGVVKEGKEVGQCWHARLVLCTPMQHVGSSVCKHSQERQYLPCCMKVRAATPCHATAQELTC